VSPQRKSSDEGDEQVPGVRTDLRKSIDPEYDPRDGDSRPFDSVSVKQDEERRVWPVIWAVTTIVMVIIAVYLIFA